MSTQIKKSFYAFQWTYGRATDSRTGSRLGSYYSFDSKADRDAWVADSRTDYSSQSGFREMIASSDSELRSVIRSDAKSSDWGGPREICDSQSNYIEQREAMENYLRTA